MIADPARCFASLSMTFSARAASIVFILWLVQAVDAQNQWNLTTADFQSREVELRGVDEQGVAVARSGAAAERLGWDQVLQLARENVPKVTGGRFVLVTAGGERLHGLPVKVADENLVWSTSSLGELSMPLRQVVSVARANRVSSAQAGPAASTQVSEDTVLLANGDQVKGIISDIGNGNVIVQSSGSPVNVPLESVESIAFAATSAPQPSRERGFRVRFADGSMVRASALKLNSDRMEVKLSEQTSRQIDIANVALIEQLNGPVAWLSGLEPSENVHTPYLQTPRPARMDRSVNGELIRFGDKTYARGIGVYPYSRLTWNLDGTYGGLRTRYAIDGVGAYANVTVRIKLDGAIVHEQANFTAGKISPVIVVPLGSAKALTLEVDYGQNFSVQDKFNWIEPALTKTVVSPKPQPTTQP